MPADTNVIIRADSARSAIRRISSLEREQEPAGAQRKASLRMPTRKEASLLNPIAIIAWLRKLCPALHGAQMISLGTVLAALFQRQSCKVADLARQLAAMRPCRFKSAEQRVIRLLGNRKLSDEKIMEYLTLALLTRTGPWPVLPIAIDWTHNEKRSAWQVLVASIPLRGRAIPIAWRAFPRGAFGVDEHQAARKRTQVECEFLTQLRQRLPQARDVVILADRGFGNEEVMRHAQSLGFSFVIRLGTQAYVHTSEYGRDTLRALEFREKMLLSLRDARYKGRFRLSQLVIAYDPGQQKQSKDPDPWFLATNREEAAEQIVAWYALRMIVEETFRDEKSYLRWRESGIHKTAHYQRLFTLLALAEFLAYEVGESATDEDWLRVSRGRAAKSGKGQAKYSRVFIGLQLLCIAPSYAWLAV